MDGKQDIQTKTMVTLFGLVAEIKKELISQRTKQGLKATRASGKKLDRPKGKGKSKLDAFRPEIEALLRDGSNKAFVAKRYKTSLPILDNWLRKNDIRFTME